MTITRIIRSVLRRTSFAQYNPLSLANIVTIWKILFFLICLSYIMNKFHYVPTYIKYNMLQKDESAWTAEPRRLHCGGETAPDTTCVMRVASTIRWTGKTGHWLSPRDVWWVISPPLFAFGARYIIIRTRVCFCCSVCIQWNNIIVLPYIIWIYNIYIYTYVIYFTPTPRYRVGI